ncbi:GGDEF domain-containing protein [Aliarcobacter butzleri]|jgi:diguanylate cyclase (GGDEF)-like protein|uniref:diguanylate cyclase n=3 Tax=Aliarcobacter butzleri TaxID=28197 RepID=A0AAP4PE65_9BACT|nr:GGDEF domain-containing protein [Aliarcobacter butzleri]MCG3684540.1 GGDEF domain-containing protein [Aliarcobacter butzleri]MCG3688441.1 GGDEF domain-containing protein [Aliarcobacter butzleri]MDN5053198.1 GGDEF domain-containing protein [Aliarcobacter butzleri]MDN5062547.1 GGDEF domain-containing protein [Aliarcobacter butzleri]MDN5071669.1 GGDEF domain-containing protein [Aliarcobacter butzleri]
MNIKISKLFVFITIIILVIIVSSLFYIKEIRKNAIEIKEYQKNKYLMFEKIYEFKNNIDTLSKLAKEYVYTKDSSLKKRYDEVLSKNINSSRTIEKFYTIMLKKMRNLSHTKDEYDKIKESIKFIKKLLDMEQNSFKQIEINHQKAIAILFSKDYLETKEKTIALIESFILSLENRTASKLELFYNNVDSLYKKLYFLIFLGLIIFILTFWLIYKKILNPIDGLTKNIILFKENKKDSFDFKYYNDEIGFLINNFFEMKQTIDKNIEKLQYNASYDFLTKIFNRKTYFEISEEIFELSKRQNEPFSILLIDIDHFKRINDTYGHLIGDEVLKFVSSNISKLLRKSDILGRYGGEEFIVTLPNTKLDNAKTIAEKINKYIYDNHYVNETYNLQLSVSVGIAQIKKETNLTDLIHKADEALYKAKNYGRNRVVVYEE